MFDLLFRNSTLEYTFGFKTVIIIRSNTKLQDVECYRRHFGWNIFRTLPQVGVNVTANNVQ